MQYDKLKKTFELPLRLFAYRGLKNYCFFWKKRSIEVQPYTMFFVIQTIETEKVAFFKISERCLEHCRKLKKKKVKFLIFDRYGKNMRIENQTIVEGDKDLDINAYLKYQ